MKQVLDFTTDGVSLNGRRVREAHFVTRTTLPLATACQFANTVHERVKGKLTSAATVALVEPTIATAEAHEDLYCGSFIAEVSGANSRLWLIFSARATQCFLQQIFGESEAVRHGVLSPIERSTLLRIATEFASACIPLCGAIARVRAVEPSSALARAATYFELVLGDSQALSVGVLLERDPPLADVVPMTAKHLASVGIDIRAVAGTAHIPLERLASLEIGDILPMSREDHDRATLFAGPCMIARGTCGVSGGNAAFLVGTSGETHVA